MDFRVVWTPDGADILLEGGDVATDSTIVTAVLASLFSDARAPTDDSLPVLAQDLRGFWAEPPGEQYGSLLWLLRRAKALPDAAAEAKEYCETALRWLVEGGIAAAVEVSAELAAGVLRLLVRVTRGTARRWSHLWGDRLFLVVQWPPATSLQPGFAQSSMGG